MEVVLLVIAWAGLNLFVVAMSWAQRVNLTVPGRSPEEIAAAKIEEEFIFDELDAIYQIDHKTKLPRREWP